MSSKDQTAAVIARLVPASAMSTKKGSSSNAGSLPALLFVTPERIVKSKRLMAKLEKIAEVCKGARGAWNCACVLWLQ
jgi:hypothetical protein